MRRLFKHFSVQKLRRIRNISALLGILLILISLYTLTPPPTLSGRADLNTVLKASNKSPLVLHFTQAMDKASVEQAFQVFPRFPYTFNWPDRKTLEIHPASALRVGDNYRVEIDRSARSFYRKALESDLTLRYEIVGPPSVQFVFPSSSMIASDSVLTVMFDRPMALSDLSPEDLLTVTPPVSGEVRLLGLSAFQFIPESWPMSRSFELTVPSGIPSRDGGQTEEPFTWSLKTPGIRVLSGDPAPNTEEVDLNAPLTIQFNQTVDLEKIRPGTNALLFPSNDVNAEKQRQFDGFFNTEVTYAKDEAGEADHSRLVFSPTFPYQPLSDYRFVLKAEEEDPEETDPFGLEEDFELSFRTGSPDDSAETDTQADDEDDAAPAPSELSWISPEPFVFGKIGADLKFKFHYRHLDEIQVQRCELSEKQFMTLNANKSWDDFSCSAAPTSISLDPEAEEGSLDLAELGEESREPGLYALVLQAKGVEDHHLVQPFMISDTLLMLKKSAQDILVWAVDAESGEPVSRMELTFYSFDGQELGRGVTDGEGIYKITRDYGEGVSVVGKKTLEEESRRAFTYEYWSAFPPQAPQPYLSEWSSDQASRLLLFTDRSTYAAGDTVQVKGIWRLQEGDFLALPESRQVHLVLHDGFLNKISEVSIPLRRNGSFNESFSLPDDLFPGRYVLTVYQGEEPLRSARETVIWIPPAEHPLTLNWVEGKSDYRVGDPLSFVIQANYAPGIPAANLKGNFRLYRRPFHFRPPENNFSLSFGPLQDIPCFLAACPEERELRNEGDFTLDLNGRVTLFPMEKNGSALLPRYEYTLELTVENLEGVPASTRHRFTVHPGDYYLGLGAKHLLLGLRDDLELNVFATDFSYHPLPGKKVKLTLRRESDKKVELSETLSTGSEGSFFNLPLPSDLSAGAYRLIAESSDEGGRTIHAELPLYYHLPDESGSEKFRLFLDQNETFVGGKARLILESPYFSKEDPPFALITYERSRVLGYQVIPLFSPLSFIDIPIEESMVPNVYVKATFFNPSDREWGLQQAETLILVRDPNRRIQIDLSPSSSPRPGGAVELHIRTYDYQNRPVPAVVTLGVTGFSDDVKRSSWIDPADYFYAPRAQEVATAFPASSATPPRFSAIPLTPVPKEASPESSPIQSLFFDPLVVTDEGGEAKLEFTLPEHLRGATIQALATQGPDRFGLKALSLRLPAVTLATPLLPPAVAPGDEFRLGLRVSNPGPETLDTSAKLISESLNIKGLHRKSVKLAPGENAKLEWLAEVLPTHASSIPLHFEVGDESIKTFLPLQPFGKRRELWGVRQAFRHQWEGQLQLSSEQNQDVQMTLSATPMSLVLRQASHLLQLIPSSLPDGVSQLLTDLLLGHENLQEKIEALEALQKPDGGFSFWGRVGDSDPFVSAYAYYALKRSEKAAWIPQPERLEKLVSYLWESLSDPDLSESERAFILWSLSEGGQYDTRATLALYQEREALPLYAQGFLLMNFENLIRAGQRSVQPFFDRLQSEIVSRQIVEDDWIYFQEEQPDSLNSDWQTTAILLFAFLRDNPENPLLKPMVRYLATRPFRSFSSFSFQESFWMITALAAYSDSLDPLTEAPAPRVWLDDDLIFDQPLSPSVQTLPLVPKGKEALHDVRVENTGDTELFFQIDSLLPPSGDQLAPRESQILITRELGDFESGAPLNTLRVGQFFRGRLTLVVPQEVSYLALQDPLPAGAKLLAVNFSEDEVFDSYGVQENRLLIFAKSLPAGVYTINYLAQATLPGTFNHLPASANPLYMPGVYGQTGAGVIKVK